MINKHKVNIGIKALLVVLLSFFYGCKKLVEVEVPITSVSELNVYKSDATASAVLTGIYAQISATSYLSTGFPTIGKLAALSADEVTLWSAVTNQNLIAYYTNKLTSTPATGGEMWNVLYPFIFKTNAAVEGLEASTGLTEKIRLQLLGEAKFLRALFYFYLVNLYGNVPLVTGTKYEENRLLYRSPTHEVYQQIISDLIEAKHLLSENYLDGSLLKSTTERVRPTKWAALSLLSRVYLFNQEWKNAEVAASEVIAKNTIFSLVGLGEVFLKNSKEAVWQLQPVNSGYNTQEAILYVLPTAGPSATNNPIYLSKSLLNSFEPGDARQTSWVNSITASSVKYSYPSKYKISTSNSNVTSSANMSEYLMMLRLAEVYLVRAEANTQLGNISSAVDDINKLRLRARSAPTVITPNPLPALSTSLTKDELLVKIYQERRVELFTEWGHRWLDLKRTRTLNEAMTNAAVEKKTSWDSYQQLYPIPTSEILLNVNISQNEGYQN